VISPAELLSKLSAYVAEDRADAAALERIRRFVESSPDPFSRAYPEHVTGSAVVARPDGSAFLLVHHRRLDRWLQPGGHAEEEDRSIFETALREAKEETGVTELEAPLGDRVLDVDIHRVPRRGNESPHLHLDIRHLLTTTKEPAAAPVREVRGVAWYTFDGALGSGTDASFRRALLKARAFLADRTADQGDRR
jgi:8-oxo-dGTP pyrophosphatase MutT (NUDIX family)